MKIAVLGGSFNPVHTGHIALARSVVEELGYDKVLFVPTAKPPHKEADFGIEDRHRIGMLEAAVAGEKFFDIEKCEIERGGVSYTYDTVLYLMEKYRDVLEGKIGVVLGSDLFQTFKFWRKAHELSEIADLILARRPSKEVFEGEKEFSKKPVGDYCDSEHSCATETGEDFPFRHTTLSNPEVVASSSAVRMAVKSGLDFKALVPKAVYEYIVKNEIKWKN